MVPMGLLIKVTLILALASDMTYSRISATDLPRLAAIIAGRHFC
jgi:hypothetical protein